MVIFGGRTVAERLCAKGRTTRGKGKNSTSNPGKTHTTPLGVEFGPRQAAKSPHGLRNLANALPDFQYSQLPNLT